MFSLIVLFVSSRVESRERGIGRGGERKKRKRNKKNEKGDGRQFHHGYYSLQGYPFPPLLTVQKKLPASQPASQSQEEQKKHFEQPQFFLLNCVLIFVFGFVGEE